MKRTILPALAALLCTVAQADWVYDTSQDKMTSVNTRMAGLESSNSLNLGFPYKGTNHGMLLVRQRGKSGPEVLFKIEKGQLMCNSYNGCPIEIRFDDAKPMRFSGTPPADHSSNMVFIEGANRFISAASKAKRILVQANIYQNGAPVLEFQTGAPLTWGDKDQKPKK